MLGIFIDLDNIKISSDMLDKLPEGKILHAFADFKYLSKDMINLMTSKGYNVHNSRSEKKSNTDLLLTIKVYESIMRAEIDRVLIISGDRDFNVLIQSLQSLNIPALSTQSIQNIQFLVTSQYQERLRLGKVKKSTQSRTSGTITFNEVRALMILSLTQMRRKHITYSYLDQFMRRNAEFRYYGIHSIEDRPFRKFSDLLHNLQDQGILILYSSQNSDCVRLNSNYNKINQEEAKSYLIKAIKQTISEGRVCHLSTIFVRMQEISNHRLSDISQIDIPGQKLIKFIEFLEHLSEELGLELVNNVISVNTDYLYGVPYIQ